ncbi:MAG: class I SAM-dependent methyltransferase [Streptosporangiaceae bacterium]
MATRTERAMSFGAIAADYDRLRPSPPQEAVRWLLPAGCEVAVDLAAGTGLLTRAVAREVSDVIAVEPDARMASVLRARSPGVHVVSGRGEALPLTSGVADAVLISSAWHWMDPELAVPEIARVLRDCGRFGVIWTSRDRTVDWVAELDRLRETLTGSEYRRRRRDVHLPAADVFENVHDASFTFTRSMAAQDLVAMLGTYSGLITASQAERHEALARAGAALVARFGEVTEIEVPMRSVCWRADRIRASG